MSTARNRQGEDAYWLVMAATGKAEQSRWTQFAQAERASTMLIPYIL